MTIYSGTNMTVFTLLSFYETLLTRARKGLPDERSEVGTKFKKKSPDISSYAYVRMLQYNVFSLPK